VAQVMPEAISRHRCESLARKGHGRVFEGRWAGQVLEAAAAPAQPAFSSSARRVRCLLPFEEACLPGVDHIRHCCAKWWSIGSRSQGGSSYSDHMRTRLRGLRSRQWGSGVRDGTIKFFEEGSWRSRGGAPCTDFMGMCAETFRKLIGKRSRLADQNLG